MQIWILLVKYCLTNELYMWVCNKCKYAKCPALSQYKFGKPVIPDGPMFDRPRGDS